MAQNDTATEIDLESREHANVSEGEQVHVVYECDGEEVSATGTVTDDEGDAATIETDAGEHYILTTQNRSYVSPSLTPLGERSGYDLLSAEVLD